MTGSIELKISTNILKNWGEKFPSAALGNSVVRIFSFSSKIDLKMFISTHARAKMS